MKLVAQVFAVLALAAYAAPALPCGAQKAHTTAANQSEHIPLGKQAEQPAATPKADKAEKQKVAKSEKAKAPTGERRAAAN